MDLRWTAKSGRAFFTSVPKAGKNILTTFFSGLGLVPMEGVKTDAFKYTHAKHLESLYEKGSPVPSGYSLAQIQAEVRQLEPEMRAFLDALRRMPQGTWVNHHFAYWGELHQLLRDEHIPIVLLVRDPRDCLLSMANFLLSKGEPADLVRKLARPELEEALLLFLEGDDTLLPFNRYCDSYSGWMKAADVLTLRFEDIIGPEGGGDVAIQIESLMRLADHIGWRESPHRLASSVLGSFNTGVSTFYKGQIGQARESFSPRVRRTFAEKAADLRSAWGYQEPPATQVTRAARPTYAVGDLLARMCREQEASIQMLESEINRFQLDAVHLGSILADVERDSQARLAEIRRLTDGLLTVEQDSRERLREIAMLADEARKSAEVIAVLEGDRANLQNAHAQLAAAFRGLQEDAVARESQLREGLERWKSEAMRGSLERI